MYNNTVTKNVQNIYCCVIPSYLKYFYIQEQKCCIYIDTWQDINVNRKSFIPRVFIQNNEDSIFNTVINLRSHN